MKALAMVAPNRICKSGIQFKRNNMFPMFIYKQNNKEIIKKIGHILDIIKYKIKVSL